MIFLQSVNKAYQTGACKYPALTDVSLTIAAGEFVAIVGKSGSGKSTLLNLVGGIDTASSGTIRVNGISIQGLSQAQLSTWRGRTIGFVFQFFQLLPTLTAKENVMLPLDFSRKLPTGQRRGRALQLLDRVGVADQAGKLPFELSGGQQQRVAIARALANDPPVILADEPTGNLDSETGADMFRLFEELAAGGKTIVVVTHQRDPSAKLNRVIELADGRVIAPPACAPPDPKEA